MRCTTATCPLGGLVLLGNMMVDEVIVGGPGSGLFGILLFAIVAVFIAGLMIGRTPEYLGNKIEAREVKMAMLALLVVPAALLLPAAVAVVIPAGLTATGQRRAAWLHRACCTLIPRPCNTNGGSFAGLSTNTRFYNLDVGAGDGRSAASRWLCRCWRSRARW